MANGYEIGGTVFQNWVIHRRIGAGSFGEVFEIRRQDFGQTYAAAMKVITVPRSPDEFRSLVEDGMSMEDARRYYYTVVEEVVREFAILSHFKGTANVVSYEDHAVIPHADGCGWDILIRMELLTPLKAYVKEHPFTHRDVIRLGIGMLNALELCQRYNVIHRDIKPDNIFVSPNGDMKLGDFGIARTVERTAADLSKKGTYNYMAPEMYAGREYGFSVDIYSLGLVLYRLLNRNRGPFLPPPPTPITHADQEHAIVRRIAGEPLPMPYYGEGRLAEIVLKACAYDPQARYTSPAAMRMELEAILYQADEAYAIYPEGDQVELPSNRYQSAVSLQWQETARAADQTPVPPPPPPPPPRVKKKKRGWIAIPVVLLILAIGIGAAVVGLGNNREEAYNALVDEAEAVVMDNPREALELLDEALKLDGEAPRAHAAYAYALYRNGEYARCVDYIVSDLALGKAYPAEVQTTLSEILGAAHFEQQNYVEAAAAFQLSAAGEDMTVPALRDYAVSLGRLGEVEAAGGILQRMIQAGADDIVTSYVRGEVDLAMGRYTAAEEAFQNTLAVSDDRDLLQRAVRSLAEVYRRCAELELQGELSPIPDAALKQAQVLEQGISLYRLEMDAGLWEMQGGAWYTAWVLHPEKPAEYAEKAAACFQTVIDLGAGKDYIYSDLYAVYYGGGLYEQARDVLMQYEEAYPNSYVPHALRAMLEITLENEKSQSERDYTAAYEQYLLAGEKRTGSDDLSYYQQLESLILQLQENGWL